jgi:SAM-dependent methyltransferase
MGINASSAEFLLHSRSSGISFRNMVTLGRQNLSVDDRKMKRLLNQYGIADLNDVSDIDNAFGHDLPHPADSFFKALGAARIDSIDADAYQASSIVHDMNLPIPAKLHKQYDCVVDGGTLEHIFAFPTAIRNCMEMVKVGGHLILMTPANNFFGHGFYQFSPELFFRILSPENGFCLERMFAVETENVSYKAKGKICYYERSSRPYNVLDPAVTGKRGLLQNDKMVLLYIQAKRQTDVPFFAKAPQQSDYVSQWHESRRGMRAQSTPTFEPFWRKALDSSRNYLKEALPPYFRLRYYQRSASFRNSDTFR